MLIPRCLRAFANYFYFFINSYGSYHSVNGKLFLDVHTLYLIISTHTVYLNDLIIVVQILYYSLTCELHLT